MMTTNGQHPPAVAGVGGAMPSRAGSSPRISLKGIRKAFGSHQALRGVDLDIYPGECLGLVGDNAAGKPWRSPRKAVA